MFIAHEIKLVLLLLCLKSCVCVFEGNVVGGGYANIENFPHSASLSINCMPNTTKAWICGSSILTHRVLLTAAHCLEDCSPTEIVANVGNVDREEGTKHLGVVSYMHEKYDSNEMNDDVALVGLVRSLKLNDKVRRVIVLERPPPNKMGVVAGWGLIQDEYGPKYTTKLKQTIQEVLPRKACLNYLSILPMGTLCAGKLRAGSGYTAVGDSGNALMVNNVVQIGIVSYKIPRVKKSLSVYTDVGYHYNWIKRNALRIHCTATKIAKVIREKRSSTKKR